MGRVRRDAPTFLGFTGERKAPRGAPFLFCWAPRRSDIEQVLRLAEKSPREEGALTGAVLIF